MNLNNFMSDGIKDIAKTVGRFYLGHKPGREFLLQIAPWLKRSASLRDKHEAEGTHIPPFLIASIASQCNLHCAGCYARAGGACGESAAKEDLSAQQWQNIFAEAEGLGISFVLLAGGEPLLRRDVIETAAKCSSIVFPIFTNGTMIDSDYIDLFDQNRQLVPVLSIEGGKQITDARRGGGVYEQIQTAMALLKERHILFGASITVSKENLEGVLQEEFIAGLRSKGCGIVFFVEYVPVEPGAQALVLDMADMQALQQQSNALKSRFADMVILCFPGDEVAMGGCLASGRGFFHINSTGGAEPCPFSPYSKYNLKDKSILQVLGSQYFANLRKVAADAPIHSGGCVLFEREEEVRKLLARAK